jgi:hypothetical protein
MYKHTIHNCCRDTLKACEIGYSGSGVGASMSMNINCLYGRHDWIRTSDLFRVKEAL